MLSVRAGFGRSLKIIHHPKCAFFDLNHILSVRRGTADRGEHRQAAGVVRSKRLDCPRALSFEKIERIERRRIKRCLVERI